MKNKICKVLMCLIVVMQVMGYTNVKAAENVDKQAALSMYKEFLYKNKWENSSLEKYQGKKFTILDVTGDAVPELIIASKRNTEIFSCNGEEVTRLYQIYGNTGFGMEIYYNRKKKSISCGGELKETIAKLGEDRGIYIWDEEEGIYEYGELSAEDAKILGSFSRDNWSGKKVYYWGQSTTGNKAKKKYKSYKKGMKKIKLQYNIPQTENARREYIDAVWEKNNY